MGCIAISIGSRPRNYWSCQGYRCKSKQVQSWRQSGCRTLVENATHGLEQYCVEGPTLTYNSIDDEVLQQENILLRRFRRNVQAWPLKVTSDSSSTAISLLKAEEAFLLLLLIKSFLYGSNSFVDITFHPGCVSKKISTQNIIGSVI